MQVYLVGGAVRDKLLGLPIKEKDWVVVGATIEELTALGYQQVGRNFPVFLHPQTKEEYSLARTEKKTNPGYTGFSCDFLPTVKLEDDLLRRDLTINAMAMDSHGNIIDPFNGQADLTARILRHVSPAFIEDPVRVLRIARFAARYYHLGFTIANETRHLLYKMVKNGELHALVAERVWQEWSRSLAEQNPQIFITTLRSCGALQIILPEIDHLFGIPNPPASHPEIDTGIHTLMALQEVVKLSADNMIRFATLVHDAGKAATPIEKWPSHICHTTAGVTIINKLCKRLRIPTEYRTFAEMAARFHIKIHNVFNLQAKTKINILEQTDAFRRPHLFEKLLLVCTADAIGRKILQKNYEQLQYWRELLANCSKISAQAFIERGYKGDKIKNAMHEARVHCAKLMWKENERQ